MLLTSNNDSTKSSREPVAAIGVGTHVALVSLLTKRSNVK
ncbi:hypothetical protein Nizo2814_0740 [Lactiplantibacillus plantarum]|nr:hypothetical protein Nizo2814_0740 [Lactiplantibacillus plantarum]